MGECEVRFGVVVESEGAKVWVLEMGWNRSFSPQSQLQMETSSVFFVPNSGVRTGQKLRHRRPSALGNTIFLKT